MSPLQRASWGLIVTVSIAVAAWIFGAGGAYLRANLAYGTACEARTIAEGNRVELKGVMSKVEANQGTIQANQAAIMRELDMIQKKLDQ